MSLFKPIRVSETKEFILPDMHAIKLSRGNNNKTRVALIQLKQIQTRLKPQNTDIYYSVKSKMEIHKIKKIYESIKLFRDDYPEKPFFNNCHWKHEVENIFNKN